MATEDLIREALDPNTSAARLAELVQADPATWSAVAAHPAAYPGLLQWLSERGDPATNVALSSRASAPAPTEVLPTTPPSAVETPAEQTIVTPVETPAEPTVVTPVETPAEPTIVAPAAALPTEQTATFEAAAPGAPVIPPYVPASTTADQPNKRNFWILAGMVAVVLVLIGGIAFGATKVFGGDDDKNEVTPTKTSAPTDEPSDDFPTDEPTDEFTTDEPGSSGDSGDFCDAFNDLQSDMTGLDPTDFSALSKLGDSFSSLGDSAPDDIRDDVQVMADYFDEFSDPANIDPEKLGDRITEFSSAAQKVTVYYAENCS